MKRFLTRILSLMMVLCMLVSLAPLSASASSNTVSIDITVDYERSFDMLDSINALRVQNKVPALVMTQGMMDAAIQRSAELMVNYSKTRPNNDICYNAYPYSGGWDFEEYYGYDDRSSNERWLSYYTGSKLLQSDYKTIGVSVFTHNNYTYILFATSILEDTAITQPETAQAVITKEVDLGSNVYTISLLGQTDMEAGKLQTLQVRQKINGAKSRYSFWNNDSVSWSSSNPAVATVHNGEVTALSAGTAEITVQGGACSASFTVTVTGEAAHVHSLQYVAEIAPTYYDNGRAAYWLCSVCDCMYRDEAATQEVTAADLVIPMLVCAEHAWDAGTVTKAATSSKEGNKLYVCVNCSAKRNDPVPVNGKTPMHSGDLARAKPTEAQLYDAIIAVTDVARGEARYVEEPSTTYPYKAGVLTDEFLNTGLSLLNFVRYMAGLPSVRMDDAWNEEAQHGAVVLAAIDELTHDPGQPYMMDKEFYEIGHSATMSSNISQRGGSYFNNYNALHSSLLGCLDDTGSLQNLSGVGHRMHLLSVTLEKVGFGAASHITDADTTTDYITTKVFSNGEYKSDADFNYNFVSWPASGYMATNTFGYDAPWSITLNPDVYAKTNYENLKVTLTRVADNTVWVFDANTADPTEVPVDGSEMYWSVMSNAIIFSPGGNSQPDRSYSGTGGYLVDVEGLTYVDGSPASIYYEVEFVTLKRCQHENTVDIPAVAATCTATGLTKGSKCVDCGEILEEQRSIPAIGHIYDQITHVCGCGKVEAFTVTWMVDGEVYAATQQEYGMLVALPQDPYKQECEFIGWSTAAEGGEFVTAETVFNGTNAAVYYAQFTAISYPVCLFGNGGIVTDAFGNSNNQVDVNLKAGYDLTKLGDMGFVRAGYTFAGWKFFDITRKELDVTVMSGDVYYGRAQWKCAHETVKATDNGNGTHELICTAICEETIATAEEHNFKNDAHTCICGVVCKHENTVDIPAVAATCTATGLTKGSKCSDCGNLVIAQTVVPKLGHSFVEGKCERCDLVKSDDELGDINGDSNVNSKDLVRLRKYFADPDNTEISLACADVNLDGVVNSKDLVRMRKHFADGVALGG